MKVVRNITQTYRSTGRNFTLVTSFTMSPSESTASPLDFVGHKLVAFDLLLRVRTGISDSGRGGGGGGGSGGGGGGSCACESDADDEMTQLTATAVSSLSIN